MKILFYNSEYEDRKKKGINIFMFHDKYLILKEIVSLQIL